MEVAAKADENGEALYSFLFRIKLATYIATKWHCPTNQQMALKILYNVYAYTEPSKEPSTV